MKIKTIGNCAVIEENTVLITDIQSALDLIATVQYETGIHTIILQKAQITEPFFDLKTTLAGQILEKFIQYRTRLAIVGDFSVYDSKALRDFIRESNRGPHIYFAGSTEDAAEHFAE